MSAWLLAFFTVYLGVAFVLPTVRVRRRDGVNALVIQRDDSAHGVVGRWFAAVLVGVLTALTLGLDPDLLGRLEWAEHRAPRAAGATLLAASLILVVVAQARMGKSWRIGIDLGGQPPLVRDGPFAISRNPYLPRHAGIDAGAVPCPAQRGDAGGPAARRGADAGPGPARGGAPERNAGRRLRGIRPDGAKMVVKAAIGC